VKSESTARNRGRTASYEQKLEGNRAIVVQLVVFAVSQYHHALDVEISVVYTIYGIQNKREVLQIRPIRKS